MSDWFYAKGAQQHGPVPADELRQLIATGAVTANDLVWREGMPNWVPATAVAELFPRPSAPAYPPYGYGQQQPPPPQQYDPTQQAGGVAPNPAQPLPYGHYAYPPSPGAAPPPNYLVPAILVTVACCLPMGVVSIVFASQVNSAWAVGDVAGAMEASRKAKFWAWMAFGFGLASQGAGLALFILGIVAEASGF